MVWHGRFGGGCGSLETSRGRLFRIYSRWLLRIFWWSWLTTFIGRNSWFYRDLTNRHINHRLRLLGSLLKKHEHNTYCSSSLRLLQLEFHIVCFLLHIVSGNCVDIYHLWIGCLFPNHHYQYKCKASPVPKVMLCVAAVGETWTKYVHRNVIRLVTCQILDVRWKPPDLIHILGLLIFTHTIKENPYGPPYKPAKVYAVAGALNPTSSDGWRKFTIWHGSRVGDFGYV